MGRPYNSYGGTEHYKKSSCCTGRRKKTEGQAETKMGRWCDGRCQEVGGEKLEECCKEQGQLAEASEEGLGSKKGCCADDDDDDDGVCMYVCVCVCMSTLTSVDIQCFSHMCVTMC